MPREVKQRRLLFVALVAGVLVALGIGIFWYLGADSSSSLRDPRAVAGQLANKSAEEVQEELNRQVEEGMFAISIASYIPFSDGKAQGELRIENVPGNHSLMGVKITCDETGETVYETELIEPGYCIQNDTLDAPLPKGTYACTAVFTAYDPQTEKPTGAAAAEITIVIEN